MSLKFQGARPMEIQSGPASESKGDMERDAHPAFETTQPPSERSNELVENLIAALEVRGVPQGAWLVDISRVRNALQEADGLLRRLEDAIIRDASSSSGPA
jgi:hypothetical protein